MVISKASILQLFARATEFERGGFIGVARLFRRRADCAFVQAARQDGCLPSIQSHRRHRSPDRYLESNRQVRASGMTDPTLSTASARSILPTTDPGMPRACLKMGRGSAAGEFWVGQGGERRGGPPAVCSARTNAVQARKTRRPEGLGGKGPLAALLVGHRPLRVCSLLAPCQSNPSLPNRTPPHFQTGSKESVL